MRSKVSHQSLSPFPSLPLSSASSLMGSISIIVIHDSLALVMRLNYTIDIHFAKFTFLLYSVSIIHFLKAFQIRDESKTNVKISSVIPTMISIFDSIIELLLADNGINCSDGRQREATHGKGQDGTGPHCRAHDTPLVFKLLKHVLSLILDRYALFCKHLPKILGISELSKNIILCFHCICISFCFGWRTANC